MISSFVALALTADTVVLRRGVVLDGPHKGVLTRYWDVQEAQIDAEGAGLPIPTGFGLTGDARRAVFMKFGSLDLALSAQSKIVEATLRLKLSDPEKSAISGVRLVKRPWLWPGVAVLSKRILAPASGAPGAAKEALFAPGVSWTHAGGDAGKWQQAGALGPDDSEKVNATIKVQGDTVEISGLGETFQTLKTHEGENFGLLIESSGRSEFWSSISPEDQPELHLKLAPAPVQSSRVWLEKTGDQVMLQATKPISSIQTFIGTSRVESKNLTPPSASVPLSFDAKSGSKDRRNQLFRIVASAPDGEQFPPIIVHPAAPWKAVSPEDARAWNFNVIDASPYSFAPIGALSYVNPLGPQTKVDLLKEFFPNAVADDNRTDIALLNRLVPPARATENPLFKQLARPEAGPLSMFQVDRLLQPTARYPKVLILRAITPAGLPLPGAKLKFMDQPEAIADKNGYVFPTSPADGWTGMIRVEGESNGIKDAFEFSSAQLSNLYARGMVQAASVEIPLDVPAAPITLETNLVLGKPVRDSAGSFPAQLLGLTDDSDLTTYTLAPGAWLEIDLGRDRFLGCVRAKGSLPKSFTITVYGTTEKPEQAQPWLSMPDLASHRVVYPSRTPGAETFYPTPAGARYVRMTNRSSVACVLNGIEIYPARR